MHAGEVLIKTPTVVLIMLENIGTFEKKSHVGNTNIWSGKGVLVKYPRVNELSFLTIFSNYNQSIHFKRL